MSYLTGEELLCYWYHDLQSPPWCIFHCNSFHQSLSPISSCRIWPMTYDHFLLSAASPALKLIALWYFDSSRSSTFKCIILILRVAIYIYIYIIYTVAPSAPSSSAWLNFVEITWQQLFDLYRKGPLYSWLLHSAYVNEVSFHENKSIYSCLKHVITRY